MISIAACGTFVAGGITSPSTRDVYYLKAGDKLLLACEQTPSEANPSATVVWSRATIPNVQVRAGGVQDTSDDGTSAEGRVQHLPADHDLSYQTIDTSGRGAPYTINHGHVQQPAADGASDAGASGGRRGSKRKLFSELIKTDVTTFDSGFYRCRLGNGGVSSRILVIVIDS
jgi:hypothetical protein